MPYDEIPSRRREELVWVIFQFALAGVGWLVLTRLLLDPASTRMLLGLDVLGIALFSVAVFFYLRRIQVRLSDYMRQVREVSRETKEYLEEFFDELPAGAMILNPSGKVLHCNRKAVVMLGLPEATILATNWTHPEFPILKADGNEIPLDQLPMNLVLATRMRVTEVIMGIEGLTGDWSWVSTTAEPRFEKDGTLRDIIFVLEDVTRRRAVETELTLQTFRDRLTGLPNRVLFMERLNQALLRLERRKMSVALLFLDLDRFKIVNDSLSHDLGDQLLAQVAKRIRACLRPEDTVARLGGDEFIVLLEEVPSSADAMRVADRITKSFEEVFRLGNQEIFTTCSMGLAITEDPETPPSALLRDVEVAMYRAKAKGEGALEMFDPSMNEMALYRLQIEAELRRALERNEFMLFYQPVVGLKTGKIEGWEALIRWKHPERGMVPPLDFISLAEENGLIVPIGKWVLTEACRQAAEWGARYESDPPRLMNVNISGRQFQNKDLIDTVTDALDAHRFAPRHLKLEITESVMMRDPMASLEAMKVFRSLNIHLVIDDFGTGYSSLSYLRRFPVDTLKVDKSFVDGLGKDPESTAIVQAIISLAKSLGMRVTAEGIETQEQLEHLRAMDCDQGQGYLFSRPLPSPDAELLLSRDPVW